MTAARIRFAAATAVAVMAALVTAGLAPPARAATIETVGKQAILIDLSTNTVLFDKNADERMPPSSMSKLMTLYLVFEAMKEGRLSFEHTLPVSQRAWRMQGSKMFVELNNSIKVQDLIKGVIIQSGNDACIVLAEGLAGSEQAFAEKATKRAKEIGLDGTNLVNATGWPDPNHYMTARDLATLAERIIRDFPEYYYLFSEKEFTYHGIKQGNRNPLLLRNTVGVDGLKTGHTEVGGYGLTASGEREGRRLVLVINGMPSMQARADETTRLMEWGFREFNAYPLFKAGETIEDVPVWFGAQGKVSVTVPQDLKITMARNDRPNMKVTLVTNQTIAAPLKKGDVVGKILISAPGAPTKEVPAVAATDVERLGFFGRAFSAAHYLVFGLGS